MHSRCIKIFFLCILLYLPYDQTFHFFMCSQFEQQSCPTLFSDSKLPYKTMYKCFVLPATLTLCATYEMLTCLETE